MNIHNINTIAHYEVKLLKRSWLFRIFAILALVGITMATLIYQTSVLNKFDTIWPRVAVASMFPFSCIYFYNIAQSIIVIFLAGSFLKRDKKLDTAEVIYVRPMSNADYIIGKTWGILKVFLSLNVISLLITAFINILICKSPFAVFPYVFYLLTISLPSLLFVLGLSFTIMCLLKNQAVTFIIMLGIIGTVFFYLTDRFYGVFDFFGVSIPAIFSDETGHADIRLFLLQRLIYLLAGIGLISFTIALVKRLPHKPWKTIVVHCIGAILIVASCAMGLLYILHYNHQTNLRKEYVASFNKYADQNNAEVLANNLTIIPDNKQLEGKSVMKIINRHTEALDKIILYLNPSLKVTTIVFNATPLSFLREHQVIVVDKPLQSGEEITLDIAYTGTVSEEICYTDVPDDKYLDNKIPQSYFRFGKRYAWLGNRFTLLTPECLWYPVAIPPVNPGAPYNIRKNFTDYTLTVVDKRDKTVLSQGESKKEGDKIVFTNRFPLPGISLTIADYEKRSLRVDSIDYEVYYFKGHDYFSKYFNAIADTLPGVIRDIKNDIEVQKDRRYQFGKFVIAETPVQFAGYVRNWKGYTEYVMPEIVFIPERGATLNSDFNSDKIRSREERRNDDSAPNEMEMSINSFRQFINGTFTEESRRYGWDWQNKYVNPYNIAPMFFGHTSFIRSNEYPVIDIAINTMQSTTETRMFGPWGGIVNDKQRANFYLENHSFKTATADEKIKPEVFYELLKLKSSALSNYITSKITKEEFNGFLKDFFNRNRFRDIPFDSFKEKFSQRFGFDLSEFIQTWYHVDHTPILFIRDVDANQVVVDEFTKYQVKFKVNNPSDVDAIISTQIQQGGGGGGFRHGGMMAFSISTSSLNNDKYYVIPAKEAREIRLIMDERPASLTVNTNISHNLPTSHTFNFSKIDHTIDDTTSGILPADPGLFRPNPNEIIVDNEDSGFRVIASNSRHKLKDVFKKTDDEKYKDFRPWGIPSQWTAIAADYCYGETINSAVYKRQGNGANSVEWKAEISRDGYYEVSIWNPKTNGMFVFGRRHGRDRAEERNQTYVLVYDQGKETITLDLEQEEDGWISIGSFYIPQGTATISLTDKVTGNYVIADAVKFTATNE